MSGKRIRKLLQKLVSRNPNSANDPRYLIAHIGRNVNLGEAVLAGNNMISKDCYLTGRVIVGYATTMGQNCMLFAGRSEIEIGNYCQFAPYVAVYTNDHPTSYLTTYANRRLFNSEMKENISFSPVRIGHDVWIGHGAIILKGITIGHGAVVGAGAIVTHDIPPYAIVGGNPARVIKYRFEPRIIQLLLKLEWWLLSVDDLKAYRDLFKINLNEETDRAIDLINTYLGQQEDRQPLTTL